MGVSIGFGVGPVRVSKSIRVSGGRRRSRGGGGSDGPSFSDLTEGLTQDSEDRFRNRAFTHAVRAHGFWTEDADRYADEAVLVRGQMVREDAPRGFLVILGLIAAVAFVVLTGVLGGALLATVGFCAAILVARKRGLQPKKPLEERVLEEVDSRIVRHAEITRTDGSVTYEPLPKNWTSGRHRRV